VRKEVQREPTAERHGGNRRQALAHVFDRALEAQREQDDAGDHREVQVAEVIQREPASCSLRIQRGTSLILPARASSLIMGVM